MFLRVLLTWRRSLLLHPRVPRSVRMSRYVQSVLAVKNHKLTSQKSYNPMSMKEASDLAPKIGLPNIISGLSSDFKVDRLIVSTPDYMKELQAIIDQFPVAVLQSFFIWR